MSETEGTEGPNQPTAETAADAATAASDDAQEGTQLDQGSIDSLFDDAGATPQLDQSSIDSLFGDASTGPSTARRAGLEILVGNAIVGYDRLPMLDIVVDRFARLMTTSVRKYTQDNCDISISKTRAIRVGDFLNRMSLPTMIAVIRAEQWDGYMLAALDAQLIASVVDVLLGGRRNQLQTMENRPYTPIERALIERMVSDVIIADLKKSFDTVCEIDFIPERYETTPTYAAIMELSAAAITFRADVAMDGGRGGHIDFLIPYAVLEPVRDTLAQEFIGKKATGDQTWHTHLQGEVPQASVQLQAVLEQRVATVSDISRWRPGSVLVLDRRADDLVEMFCEDMLVARAQIGEHEGRIALRVEDHRPPMQLLTMLQ